MRRALPIGLLIAIVCSSAAAQDIGTAVSRAVIIESEPPGAQVFIGDSLAGTTPLTVTHAPSTRIEAYFPRRDAWGAERIVVLPDAVTAGDGVVRLRFARRVLLRTIPYGAHVFLGRHDLGSTPMSLAVDSLRDSLTIVHIGYRIARFAAADLRDPDVTIPLEPIATPQSSPAVADLQPVFRPPGTRVIIASAIGIASGIGAVALKQAADRRYAAYLQTGDDGDLHRTRTLDAWSTACLVLVEASLGYFVWFLFSGQ